jgi:hypothetical protein
LAADNRISCANIGSTYISGSRVNDIKSFEKKRNQSDHLVN